MTGGASLYQAVILDHNRAPRNFRPLSPDNHRAIAHNPLCGDTVEIGLALRDGVLSEISFQSDSCAVATASASLLSETLRGQTISEARAICDDYEAALRDGAQVPELPDALRPLLQVRHYPGREQCATLAARAVRAALQAADAAS